MNAYFITLIISIILFAIGIIVAIKALSGSVKEVRLLRALGKLDDDEQIIGSALSSIVGAALAGIVSATIVGLYGVSAKLMYLGPLSAIVASIGVIWCFVSDLKDASEVEEQYNKYFC